MVAGPRRNASQLHRQTLKALREIFPGADIIEEYKIRAPDTNRVLWIDLYVPTFALAVEVQGVQHSRFSPFFHASRTDFLRQQSNDDQKVLWCADNDVTLIYVYEGEEITSDLIRERWREAMT